MSFTVCLYRHDEEEMGNHAMQKRLHTRILLTTLLALILVFGLLPLQVFASGEPGPDVAQGAGSLLIDPAQQGCWSILNLILSVTAMIIAIGTIYWVFVRMDKYEFEEDESDPVSGEDDCRGYFSRLQIAKLLGLISSILGVLAPITWLVVDDLAGTMVLVDSWSILIILLFLSQTAVLATMVVKTPKKKAPIKNRRSTK